MRRCLLIALLTIAAGVGSQILIQRPRTPAPTPGPCYCATAVVAGTPQPFITVTP